MRIVADTNVLVSAVIGRTLRQFREALADELFWLIFCDQTYQEFLYVLRRPKILKYVTDADLREFLDLLSASAIIVQIDQEPHDCRDPKDNIFLGCAVFGKADYLVSGDGDLLVLNPYHGIPIITPRTFFDLISKNL